MKNFNGVAMLAVLFTLMSLVPGTALAKKGGGGGGADQDFPPGLSKKADDPPKGWSQGEKKGWDGEETPRGLRQRFAGLFGGGD